MALTFYRIRENDQIYRILSSHYGGAIFLRDRSRVVQIFQANNPQVSNIDMIYPGQVIMLPELSATSLAVGMPPREVVQSCRIISEGLSRYDTPALDFIKSVDFMKIAEPGVDGFLSYVEKAMTDSRSAMKNIALQYYRKESGTISRNQYNYRRAINVKRVDMRLGPLHQLINPGKTPAQVLRIDPNAAYRTHNILTEAKKLAKISRLAENGVVVLNVVSIAGAGAQVHLASSNSERTVILLDTVAGIGGAIAGGALAVALLGTPAGWIGIAVVIGGHVGGGLIAEELGKVVQEKALYDANGNRINTRLDSAWQHFYGKD